MKNGRLVLMVVVLTLVILACSSINIDNLGDGKIRMETNMSLDLIQTALEAAANFDQMVGLTLEPRNGYIYVHADLIEIQGVTGNDVSFHLELSSSNGDLVANITNVQTSNNVFDSSQFESLNEQLGQMLTDDNGLEDITNFENVSITPDGVSMVVIIESPSTN